MTDCMHNNLVLLPAKGARLRCRHCHLTIASEELGDGHCPECYDVHGEKRNDFDPVEDSGTAITRYRCEDCGVTIEL